MKLGINKGQHKKQKKSHEKFHLGRSFILLLFLACLVSAQTGNSVRFAVIGDYGDDGTPLLEVSNLIRSWNPDLIITTGDNNYSDGSAYTIDQNIGQYFHDFIAPYTGSYGPGANENRFFPSLGNHDWKTTGAQPYLDYFTLPGNERYYEFTWGPVHFFAIDSDDHEPDGYRVNSAQASWLQDAMTNSTSIWNIVYMHHPPYSSGESHGSTPELQWPYRSWGASAVLAGHDHTYERILQDSLVYFVNGLGGKSVRNFGTPVAGSQVRYNGDYGAMRVDANQDSMVFRFYARSGELEDNYRIVRGALTSASGTTMARPLQFELGLNYPNPFNPTTTIPFRLNSPQNVVLTIFNIAGQKVKTLVQGELAVGDYTINWNAENVPSGVYFCRLESGKNVLTRKLILMR